MGKLRYSGGTGKYSKYTLKEMKELLKKYNIPGRSAMTRRFTIINALEAHDRRASVRKSPKAISARASLRK
jgi:hypothetical protein